MDSQKNILQLLGDWWAARQARRPATAAIAGLGQLADAYDCVEPKLRQALEFRR